MNRLGTLVTACIAGLVVGACAVVLLLPRFVSLAENVSPIAQIESGSKTVSSSSPNKAGLSAIQPETSADETGGGGLQSSVSDEFLDAAFAAKLNFTVKEGTRILLLPHHLVAAREIASLLSATPKPSVVYLAVPDHFTQCRTGICGEWFGREHALTGLAPFLRRAWGEDVKIEPIVVSPDLQAEKTSSTIAELVRKLESDPDAILVVSIDASHYLPAQVADFHDILTQDVIASLADLEVGATEIDAPAVLRIGLKVARALGLGDVTVQAHTNSLRILKAEISQESTSHFLASFAPGEIAPQESVTILAVGDMMLDRNVAARIKKSGADDYPFKKILGIEDRFFRGQDIVVGNLEGPIGTKRGAPDKGNVDFLFDPKFVKILKNVGFDAVSQANNHTADQGIVAADGSRASLEQGGLAVFGDQYRDDPEVAFTVVESRGKKVALVGFDAISKALDRETAKKTLAAARSSADHVIVMPHWGAEYQSKPSTATVELAHWFIDNGADAVIGGHPHWMQSVEVYKGHPIAYSLGNFVFDQDWSKETNLGLVVGLALTESGSELYLYPVQIEKSQPRLLTGKERQVRLDYLAGISDKSLSSQIKNGVLNAIKQ